MQRFPMEGSSPVSLPSTGHPSPGASCTPHTGTPAVLMVTALLRAPHLGRDSESVSQRSLQEPRDSLILPVFSYMPT